MMDGSDDEKYREAFGEHNGISADCIGTINGIKNNNPGFMRFVLGSSDAEKFSDLAWELFGGYIADNDHLEGIYLDSCSLTDSKISLLFQGLSNGGPLKDLNLPNNNFGVDGIRSMMPFLKKSREIRELRISQNRNINTECFRLLTEALQGGTIKTLRLWGCRIDDITALDEYSLPHLQFLNFNINNIQSFPTTLDNYTNLERLYLSSNKIGRDGCRSLAKLLQKDGSRLTNLSLDNNDVGDEEAEIFANSLKCNTSLTELKLNGDLTLGENYFTETGFTAFSKLLNDVSSIDGTYNSNHTLTFIGLPDSTDATVKELKGHIDRAIKINKKYDGNSHAAGRAKVIDTQLNSRKKMELSRLQGVDYSYGSIFGEIEPVLLPEVLAVVGGSHSHDELYRMLIATAPDLASTVNRKGLFQQAIAQNVARLAALEAEAAALTARTAQLNIGLSSMEDESTLTKTKEQQNKLSGKKRVLD